MQKRHIRRVLVAALLGALGACDAAPAEPKAAVPEAPTPKAPAAPVDPEKLRQQARELTDGFQAKLKQQLMDGMKAGGPVAAIQVCKMQAPLIGETASSAMGKSSWSVGRTSTRVRNPKNAPLDWQRAPLAEFATKLHAGEPPPQEPIEWAEVVDVDGEKQFRYMRAIPTGPLCLGCHGAKESLAPPVVEKLSALYPADQATGFAAGELRGAFVVTAPL